MFTAIGTALLIITLAVLALSVAVGLAVGILMLLWAALRKLLGGHGRPHHRETTGF